eukprot:g5058.t1
MSRRSSQQYSDAEQVSTPAKEKPLSELSHVEILSRMKRICGRALGEQSADRNHDAMKYTEQAIEVGNFFLGKDEHATAAKINLVDPHGENNTHIEELKNLFTELQKEMRLIIPLIDMREEQSKKMLDDLRFVRETTNHICQERRQSANERHEEYEQMVTKLDAIIASAVRIYQQTFELRLDSTGQIFDPVNPETLEPSLSEKLDQIIVNQNTQKAKMENIERQVQLLRRDFA